jgi:very-short-patch-repair endonuclease
MDRQLYNQKQSIGRRRSLRNDPTPFEKILWRHLRRSQTGYRFRRQQGIGPYIVDFYCPRVKLIVEIDGDSHFDRDGLAYDQVRDEYMRANQMHVLRFTNVDVVESMEGVVDQIINKLKQLAG